MPQQTPTVKTPHFPVRGRAGLWDVQASGVWLPITFTPNQIQGTWGHIAARCIGQGKASYAVRYLYIEYENTASPGDPVTIPSFGTDEGIEYYDNLQLSASRDFLRVPLLQEPLLGIEAGQEALFTDGESGNKLTFFAQSAGTEGVWGKAFSNAANSTVFGAALVAAPFPQDSSRDVIFARTYFSLAEQVTKDSSSQIGVTWETVFQSEP